MYFISMKDHNWNQNKNLSLMTERHVSFEDVVVAIDTGGLLDILKHPNEDRYPHQLIYVVRIGAYVYLVPFVENETEVFLKTIIPSRKATKKYLGDIS